jgi:ABC-type glycerol-3-phosphate transport system substrate-binding protein
MKHFPRLKAALGIGALLILTACGGSDSGAAASQAGSETGAAGAAGTTGQIASDSFLSQVIAIVGASSDAAEPKAIESVMVTVARRR